MLFTIINIDVVGCCPINNVVCKDYSSPQAGALVSPELLAGRYVISAAVMQHKPLIGKSNYRQVKFHQIFMNVRTSFEWK